MREKGRVPPAGKIYGAGNERPTKGCCRRLLVFLWFFYADELYADCTETEDGPPIFFCRQTLARPGKFRLLASTKISGASRNGPRLNMTLYQDSTACNPTRSITRIESRPRWW